MPDPSQGPSLRAPSPEDIRIMLSDICTNSGADISFEKFTFTNPVRFYTGTNPRFFEGTVVEKAVAQVLGAG